MSDHRGLKMMIDHLPPAKRILADRGYDCDKSREKLISRGIEPCIPPRRNKKVKRPYDRELYKKRYKVECMFGRLKDWRRVAMRYDRQAHTFFSTILIAAIVTFYLN